MEKPIQISKVLQREMCKKLKFSRLNQYYPLFKSYKDRYNFNNLQEALTKWTSYSNNIEDCVDMMLDVYDVVVEHGNIHDIDNAAKIINRNLMYVKEFIDVKNKLRNDESARPILECITELENCDRVISNHKTISNRFNIDDYVKTNSDNIKNCIFELCTFIDTYNSGLNSKFKVALEEVQYALYKNGIKIPSSKVVDYVTEYFILYEMNEKDYKGKLFDILEETIDNSILVPNTDLLPSIRSIICHEDTKNYKSLQDKLNEEYYRYLINPDRSRKLLGNTIDNMLNRDITAENCHCIIESIIEVMNTTISSANLYDVEDIRYIINHCTNSLLKEDLNSNILESIIKDIESTRNNANHMMARTCDKYKQSILSEYCNSLTKMIKRITNAKEVNDIPIVEDTNTKVLDIFDIDNIINKMYWKENIVENALINETVFRYADISFVKYITEFAIEHPDLLSFDKVKKTLINTSKYYTNPIERSEFNKIIQEARLAKDDRDIKPVNENDMNFIMEASESILHEFNVKSLVGKIEKLKTSAQNKIKSLTRPSSIQSAIASTGKDIDKAVSSISSAAKNAEVASQKAALRSYEIACDTLSKEFSSKASQEEKEALITNSVVPKIRALFATIAKGGILSLLNPAIGLCYFIVKFVTSTNASSQTKQNLLNELEADLAIIDKYIEKAEEEKDFKKMKELLIAKKKMQAQYANLKYNMNLAADSKVMSLKNVNVVSKNNNSEDDDE